VWQRAFKGLRRGGKEKSPPRIGLSGLEQSRGYLVKNTLERFKQKREEEREARESESFKGDKQKLDIRNIFRGNEH